MACLATALERNLGVGQLAVQINLERLAPHAFGDGVFDGLSGCGDDGLRERGGQTHKAHAERGDDCFNHGL